MHYVGIYTKANILDSEHVDGRIPTLRVNFSGDWKNCGKTDKKR